MEYQQQTFRGFCHRTWLQEYTELNIYSSFESDVCLTICPIICRAISLEHHLHCLIMGFTWHIQLDMPMESKEQWCSHISAYIANNQAGIGMSTRNSHWLYWNYSAFKVEKLVCTERNSYFGRPYMSNTSEDNASHTWDVFEITLQALQQQKLR